MRPGEDSIDFEKISSDRETAISPSRDPAGSGLHAALGRAGPPGVAVQAGELLIDNRRAIDMTPGPAVDLPALEPSTLILPRRGTVPEPGRRHYCRKLGGSS